MTGVLPQDALAGERLHEALDLCVECKACKAECPTGVDMAKIKYEVLAQRNKEHGTPLRAKLFANIATLAKLTSPFASVANALSKPAPVRALMQRFGGIAAARPLPAFASQTFPRWFKQHTFGPPKVTAPRGDVVLFHDTFTDYFNPEVGQAATRVLEGLGYRVVLAERTGCCGRPAISKGLLPEAKKWAQKNVEALLPYARRGVPIVGTEPSCLLTFRDEYPDLLRNEDSKTVAAQSFLLDELIVKARRRGQGFSPGSVQDRPHARRPATRPLPPEGHRRPRSHAGRPASRPRLHGAPGRDVLLRHGRQLRLRGRALRDVEGHGRDASLPGGRGGVERHRRGDYRRLLPPANRPLHLPQAAPRDRNPGRRPEITLFPKCS